MLPSLSLPIRRFLRDDDGGLSVETVLVFPMLAWAYAATFTFFDAFRMEATNTKASYTISDMLTRVTEEIDQEYVDGLFEIYQYLVGRSHEDMYLRITTVGWDADAGEYRVVWSRGANTNYRHTSATINDQADKIPEIAPGDTLILVETYMPFRPRFNVGLGDLGFMNIVPSSPRFAPQLLWEGMGDGTGVPHDDGTGEDMEIVDGTDPADTSGDDDDDDDDI
jgi:Flp pilus assembly protein TadG